MGGKHVEPYLNTGIVRGKTGSSRAGSNLTQQKKLYISKNNLRYTNLLQFTADPSLPSLFNPESAVLVPLLVWI